MLDESLKRLIQRELRDIDALLSRADELLNIAENEEPSFERLAAFFRDDSPAILFECKALGVVLDSSHRDQLFRYFVNAKVRFGVLTNGLMYQF